MHVRDFKRRPILVFRGRLAAELSIARGVTGASGTTIKAQRLIRGPNLAAMPKMKWKAPKSYTMYFDFDNSAMYQPATVLMANIFAEWKGHSAQVTLVGHTDTAGSSAYNQAVSERRALTVQQIMIEADGHARADHRLRRPGSWMVDEDIRKEKVRRTLEARP